MKRRPRVAIVGRPNVGKSTLFNRIAGKPSAIVHPESGVTRDVQRAAVEWKGVPFEIIDTGGLFSGIEDELIRAVEDRALREATEADAMIFVVDAQTGLTSLDVRVAEGIRKLDRTTFVAVNKSERSRDRYAEAEFFQLGFELVYPVSAIHGQGVGELLDELVAVLPKRSGADPVDELRLAIVGRPNVGKTSLTNALVGEEKNIVDSRPGTTRDSVDLKVRWHGHDVVLVDTAGIRRRSKTKDGLSALTAIKSIEAIERADVALLVLDATRGIANQDVKVASYAHKAGKGIVFCVNKWDLVPSKDNSTVPQFERRIRGDFAFARYAPILFTSAVTSQRVSKIFPMAWDIKTSRERRVATSELNRFVEALVRATPPPAYGGGNGRIYYAAQVGVAPPTFAFFVNRRAYFSRSYRRFLNNRLRERFKFDGTLIRIKLSEKAHGGVGS